MDERQNVRIMSKCDAAFDLKMNVGHSDLYFIVWWFCLVSSRLFDGWIAKFWLMSQFDASIDPKNKFRSPWSIFHGPVILS